MATLALIENIQREELTPIEKAHAYQELLRINKLTQDELAKSLGKTQATVANKLRLLKLSKKVIEAINSKKITERHGRAMVKLDESAQEKILSQILSQNLNVSQTEEKIDTYLKIKKDVKPASGNANYDAQKLVIKLTKEIAKLKEKYGIDLNKEEAEGAHHRPDAALRLCRQRSVRDGRQPPQRARQRLLHGLWRGAARGVF